MTVGDLIAELQKHDADLTVEVPIPDYDGAKDWTDAETVYVTKTRVFTGGSLAEATVTLGVVVAIEPQEYLEAAAQSPIVSELAGSKYSMCLVRCMENMVAWLNQEKKDGDVEYLFEDGCEHQPEAMSILGRISQSPKLNERYRRNKHSFIPKSEKSPWLYPADLLAWEWQRAHVNATNPHRNERRPTLKTLFEGTPHLTPEYQTATMVNIRAAINKFYGLTGPRT